MKDAQIFLNVAKDEIETLIQYQGMIDDAENPEDVANALNEIMGDEFNHALIALISASKLLGIEIAQDDISVDPNDIKVE